MERANFDIIAQRINYFDIECVDQRNPQNKTE